LDIFSARLKWLREKRGMSQKEMAEKLGMSPQGYGKIENGQREPNLDTLVKIRKTFAETLDFLLGISDHPINVLGMWNTYRDIQEVVKRLYEKRDEVINTPELVTLPDEFVDIEDYKTYIHKAIDWRIEKLEEIEVKLLSVLEDIPMLSSETELFVNNRKKNKHGK